MRREVFGRIDGVQEQLGQRMDGVERELKTIAGEVVAVQVAVAGIGGPGPRLLLP